MRAHRALLTVIFGRRQGCQARRGRPVRSWIRARAVHVAAGTGAASRCAAGLAVRGRVAAGHLGGQRADRAAPVRLRAVVRQHRRLPPALAAQVSSVSTPGRASGQDPAGLDGGDLGDEFVLAAGEVMEQLALAGRGLRPDVIHAGPAASRASTKSAAVSTIRARLARAGRADSGRFGAACDSGRTLQRRSVRLPRNRSRG